MLLEANLNVGTDCYYMATADNIVQLIQNKRALIYTDFVKDVVPLSIALREKELVVGVIMGRI